MINYDLFLEDGDLLEMVETSEIVNEGFLRERRKYNQLFLRVKLVIKYYKS